jgi:hypothetical protein
MIIETAATDMTAPRRSVRFRFSLRGLLLLTAVCASVLYLGAMPLYDAYREQNAVTAIQQLGGQVGFATDPTARRSFFVRQVLGDARPAISVDFDHGVALDAAA